MVDIEAIKPICVPVAPNCAANNGSMGDFDMVELNIENVPQQPIIIINRNSVDIFLIDTTLTFHVMIKIKSKHNIV